MAELHCFQDIILPESGIEPIYTAISSDSLTVIVVCSDNCAYIYKRSNVDGQFEWNLQVYKGHEDSKITAISIQERGKRAASGDENGWIHIWDTDDCSIVQKRHVALCRTVSLAVSENYILASFYHEEHRNGQMALISTGKGETNEWTMVRKVTGIISHVTVSEFGKPKVPQIVYYTNGQLVYDRDPSNDLYTTRAVFKKDTPPWCIKRNKGAGFLAFSIFHRNELIIWAPQDPPSKTNPFILNLSSEESLKINETLSVSSVVSYNMFLASIFDKKIMIIRATRSGERKELANQKEGEATEIVQNTKDLNLKGEKRGARNTARNEVKKIVQFDLNTIDSKSTPAQSINKEQASLNQNEGEENVINKEQASLNQNEGEENVQLTSSVKMVQEADVLMEKCQDMVDEQQVSYKESGVGTKVSKVETSSETTVGEAGNDKEEDVDHAKLLQHRFWGLF